MKHSEKILEINLGALLFSGAPVRLYAGHYATNMRWALYLTHEDPEFGERFFMILTTNLPNEDCLDDEVFIKDHSENAGAVAWCIANGVVEFESNYFAQSDFVKIGRFKLTQAVLDQLHAKRQG